MSLALHAGVFAAGLAIGAVAVTATSKSLAVPASTAPTTTTTRLGGGPPTSQDASKLPQLVPRNVNANAVEILKYGFPGALKLL
jgi:hypothetical protein